MKVRFFSAVILLFTLPGVVRAASNAFDLPGPGMQVRVTRAGKTLPIADVPNLQAGDRVWVHADLPEAQSVHYLLVAVFLRGATNPPPENWFIKVETWDKKVKQEGTVFTVPQDAQQMLLFLAPETSGDFSNLRSAVRGKPGAFVRAAQDLNQAGLDRSRLDTYLEAIHQTSDTNPDALHDRSLLLARSLAIKLDQQCFDKPTAQQAPCLVQNTDQLVLEDNSQSMVSTLTSGASSDLIGQISLTRSAGAGAYSPYFGAVVDVARLFESFHNPEFQYIPALAVPKVEEMSLKLNNPPSFRKPMSVLVIAMPPVAPAQPPQLRAVNPNEVSCLQKPGLVLPVEGGPLVFSTGLAHDFVLHVETKSGQNVDLPASADPVPGGFVINAHNLKAANLDPEAVGTLRGSWGFDAYQGPSFHLRSVHSAKWSIPAAEHTALIVGREDTFHLQAEDTSCVAGIVLRDRRGKETAVTYKPSKPGELEAKAQLKDADPGPVTIVVKQYGLAEPDSLPMQAYAEASRLDEFALNAGDHEGIVRGTRLDQVSGIDINAIHFDPKAVTRSNQSDELQIVGPDSASTAFTPAQSLIARVALKDGRTLDLPTTIGASRPKVSLVNKNVDPGDTNPDIKLGSSEEVPQEGKLSFLLKTESPATFTREETIEVAAVNGSFSTALSLDAGTLILEDSQTVLAQLDPLKSFGRSAFGPLRFRAVAGDGRKGDWQPLATLVRVPALSEVVCAREEPKQCTLSGSSLFLLDSVATDPGFTQSVSIPLGFMNSAVEVPRPSGSVLYVKLRDDPSVVSVASLPLNSARMQKPKSAQSAN